MSYYSREDYRGLLNDLDGGNRFQPRGYMVENGGEYLIELKEAFSIKAYSNSKEFENTVALNPEMKAIYKELADKLKENDNPVVMIVRLKK